MHFAAGATIGQHAGAGDECTIAQLHCALHMLWTRAPKMWAALILQCQYLCSQTQHSMLVDFNVLVNQMTSIMLGTVHLNKMNAILSIKCFSVKITSQQNSQLCTPPLQQQHEAHRREHRTLRHRDAHAAIGK
jgi:hypothetical protein